MLLRSIIAVILWSATLFPGVAAAAAPKRAEEAFVLSAARDVDGALQLTWSIAAGHYLYRDKLAATAEDGRHLSMITAPGEAKDDPNFGLTEIYHGAASARIAPDELRTDRSVRVSFQGCAEQGICYPVVTETVDLDTLAVVPEKPQLLTANPPALRSPEPSAAAANSSSTNGSTLLAGSLPLVFASFLGFGLLLAMTPCVFPMIPILSGMLARSGEQLSPKRAFVLSTAYALAMGLAYGALGFAAAWSGQNLQLALQTPLALVAMAAVFAALALSMFGLYDLQVPSAAASKFTGAPGRGGSIVGAAVLGFGSALIVGPCVTPPLAAALLYVGSTGDVLRGGVGLFALGFGMGLPLIAFGTLGGSLLPKSGPWLAGVKQAFGFAFLLLSVSMISRILPPNAAVGLWGVSAVLLAGGLVWWSGALPAIARPVGALGMVYGAILLVGFAAGSTDPIRPLAVFASSGPAAGASDQPDVITSVAAFEARLTQARSANRPILVDFTADWCTTCKDIDRTVLSDASVKRRLEKAAFLRVDVTTHSEDLQRLMDRYAVVGPPTMFFLDPRTGAELEGARSIGELSVDDFGRMLDHAGA